jgi:alpha-glucoside transport system substrate-binding protein
VSIRGLALLVCATVIAGCTTTVAHVPATSSATDAACATFASYPRAPGTTVTFLISESNQTSPPLQTTWADFSRCTGIRIVDEVDSSTTDDFNARIDAGDAPDLTVTIRPGALADLVHREQRVGGHPLVPVPSAVSNSIDRYWNAAWKADGTVDGTLYGAPWGADSKSLVWYSPKRFKDAGYSVPGTWAQLMSLSDRIARGNAKPWCGGLESGPATGWPATDWLEEIVLGLFGGAVYDDWVAGRIRFDSPQIRSAMRVLERWMRNPAYVNGGAGDVASMARTWFEDVGQSVLDGTCFMYPFPSYYASQWGVFNPGVTIGPQGDIYAFALPPLAPGMPSPVVGGGEFMVAFSDRPEVQEAEAYLTSPDWAIRRAKLPGGWVTANRGVPITAYSDPTVRLSAQMLTSKTSAFRFDGSDLMPDAVQKVEWKQLTAWFAEAKPTRDVLQAIDTARPPPAGTTPPH